MNAARKLEEFIGSIDINPKLPIFVEELPVPTLNLYLHIEDDIPKAYHINHLLESKEASLFLETTAVYYSSYGARLRAQIEFPQMELFPNVDVNNIGNLKEYMSNVMSEGNQMDEVIDCQTFSRVACFLWEKSKKQSFPVIRNLIAKDARYTAQMLTKLKIKIQG
ncbi:MAG: hypothetical protein WC319_02680 [Candidatus Paceibacterota bacterium]|jgi:hypothetical protein